MTALFLHRPQNQKHASTWAWLVVALLACATGIYLLLLAMAPEIAVLTNPGSPERVKTLVKESQPGDNGNRLYIPSLNIDVAIAEGDKGVLDKGAWHRAPESGNPQKGGNFVLSAHRFAMGLTPQQTLAKSPFYRIDKLQIGDQLLVDYNNTRYAYKVSKLYQVPRTAVEIEGPSENAKMTLYSCDLRGEKSGRYVVEATPLAELPDL